MFKNGVPGIPLSKDWSTHKKLAFFKMMVDAGVLPWATFTGNPVQFRAEKAHTLKSVSVAFSPIQDLHGYDAPWPAGGGKNKFNIDRTQGSITGGGPSDVRTFDFSKYYVGMSANNYLNVSAINSFSVTGNEIRYNAKNRPYGISFPLPVEESTTYYLSGTGSEGVEVRVGYYDADGNYLSATGATNIAGQSITTPASAKVANIVFTCSATGENTDLTVSSVQFELGSTSTSWTPYSNICPISGWTGIELDHTGENLWGGDAYYMGISSSVPAIISFTKRTSPYTTTSNYTGIGFAFPVKAGVTYAFSSDVTAGEGTGTNFYIGIYPTLEDATDRSKCLQYTARQSNFTAEYDGIAIFMKQKQASGSTFTWTYAQANLGSTASPYTPYTGETIPITWQDEAGTVYGGYLLINEDGSVDLIGAETAYTIPPSRVNLATSWCWTDAARVDYGFTKNFTIKKCNWLKPGSYGNLGGSTPIVAVENAGYIYIGWDNMKSVLGQTQAEIRQYLTEHPLVINFDLPTPVTYHLPSLAEAIRCFKGINIVWSDANGDVTVEARAEAVNNA